ncbi:MAG: hypothetical protein MUC29_00300 [Pyrinomonadaceae bacterium]|jgi:hypothetical protein|nr:hypothetical protein [Pyrinomonadaceae bacterium]
MVYISLILSILILFFVIRLMMYQKRFDILNGLIITGALTVVLLDIDTLVNLTEHPSSSYISFAVLILWFINMQRKPKETEEQS